MVAFAKNAEGGEKENSIAYENSRDDQNPISWVLVANDLMKKTKGGSKR
jgi:hypothetical protein